MFVRILKGCICCSSSHGHDLQGGWGVWTAFQALMLESQVGVLRPNNVEQVDFAYKMYEATSGNNYELSQKFKSTNSYVNPFSQLSLVL